MNADDDFDIDILILAFLPASVRKMRAKPPRACRSFAYRNNTLRISPPSPNLRAKNDFQITSIDYFECHI